MFKQSITYTDYDGAERTENFYFNLTKADLSNRTNQARQTETCALTNCKNCGAPLSRYPCKCEYCGTEYYNGIRDIGKIDEWDEVRLFADGEEFVRATSAGGVITVNEARRMVGFEEFYDLERDRIV